MRGGTADLCPIFDAVLQVDYKEIPGNVPLDERLAVWLSAEFLLNTAVREGLNLWPLEYVFMRQVRLEHAS